MILDLSVSIDSIALPLEKFLQGYSTQFYRGYERAVSAYLLGEVHHTLRQSYLTKPFILFFVF